MEDEKQTNAKLILSPPDDLWIKFKRTVSKSVSLHEAVVSLIRDHVERFERRKTIPLDQFIKKEEGNGQKEVI